MTADFPRISENKMVATVFYNLISEMTYHHFCDILLVIQTNPVIK